MVNAELPKISSILCNTSVRFDAISWDNASQMFIPSIWPNFLQKNKYAKLIFLFQKYKPWIASCCVIQCRQPITDMHHLM